MFLTIIASQGLLAAAADLNQQAAQFLPYSFCEQDPECGRAWARGREQGEGKGIHLREYGLLMPAQGLEISLRPI